MNEKNPERTPSFEESMAQLEAIIGRIESGGAGLEESLREYERAVGLLAQCQKVLANAELKIEELNRRGAAAPATDLPRNQEDDSPRPIRVDDVPF